MKHLLFCVVAATSLGGCASNPAPNASSSASSARPKAAPSVRQIVPKGTTSFSSKKQGFAVWLPTKPEESHQSAPMGNGETLSTFIFAAPTEVVNYVILAMPTTPSANVSDPKGQLDVIEKSALETVESKSPGANVQKREELQMGDFQGRELKMSLLKGAATTRTRLFFTPKIVYQIVAGGKKADVEKQSAQINRVFDSFRILPQ